MSKLPHIQFYTGDWLNDAVAGCSLAAQGLWLRMMILMHDSPRYGYLLNANGSAMQSGTAAQRCGCRPDQYEALLQELDSVGVPSRQSEIIFSRRMVRDAKKRAEWRKRKKKQRVAEGHASVTPMSQGLSSSLPLSKEVKETNNTTPAALDGLVPIELWAAFVTHRHKLRKPLTPHAVDLILHKLQVLKSQGHDPISLLDTAIERGWLTVFTPDGGGNGRTGSTQNGTDTRKERAEQKHQDTQQVIASVLGHGSRLAERLRENLPK